MQVYRINEKHEVTPVESVELNSSDWSIEKRRVAEDTIGDYWVSTVFLVLNLSFNNGPPMLFETMVQKKSDGAWEGPDGEEIQERCSTWDEAVKQHKRIVNQIKELV